MKSLTQLTILLIFSNFLNAQEEFKKIAFSNAKAMIEAYNEHDYIKVGDFLTPEQYPYEDKTKLYESLKKALEHDTRVITDLKLERFGIFNDTQQAYFSIKSGGRNASFFGISSYEGINWFFTQIIGRFNYEQIKKMMMPQLDSSFADLDPNYKNRISYNEGEAIPPFAFEDINGNKFDSEELQGKVIVLNFWSTTCGPCIKEMPHLNKLVDKMKDKDIVFIAPAFHSSKIELNSFLSKHPFSYNIVALNADDYNIWALPTHIIIDRNQKVIGKYVGSSDENLMEIESILNIL
jgi:thiol-disulfide isomerase/thioredoxin